MIEIQRILCPIDFSDFSRRALDHAVAIAKWYESAVTLLHVCTIAPVAAYAPGSVMIPSAALTPEDRDAILASLKRLGEDAAAHTNVPFEFDIAEGPTAAEILAKADAMAADLLVLGTHGRSGFERLVLGSVTEKVLRKAACPVLTVPSRVSGAAPAPPVLFKRIVCAVDFSECSMRALTYAMSLAQEADANLTVVHVIELPPSVPREVHEPGFADPRSLREYVTLAEEASGARLKEVIPESVRAYCTVETLLPTGKPYREVLRVADEGKADLIVVGVQGRGAADRLFFGSTTQHLVRQASCPVLTLRTG
jgi:nucleotide-binding universal stress UspA family protein